MHLEDFNDELANLTSNQPTTCVRFMLHAERAGLNPTNVLLSLMRNFNTDASVKPDNALKRILSALIDGPQPVAEICKRSDYQYLHVHRNLHAFALKGYLTLEQDPNTGRKRLIATLTDAGRAVVQQKEQTT